MLLVQTPACAQQVSLTWDASVSSNVAGYKIHYGTVSGNYSWVVDAGNNTSCTISGLSIGATYYFAATAYDSAGDRSGYSNEVSYNRILALEKMKDWQGLLEWCLKWTKSEPENADAWHSLGGAYGYLNRYNDAVEAYRQAIKINPENADAWHNLGVAYYKLNRYNDAIEAYRQAATAQSRRLKKFLAFPPPL